MHKMDILKKLLRIMIMRLFSEENSTITIFPEEKNNNQL